MDERILATFDDSLRRCTSDAGFLDRFYENFLASSPKVKEKFANTDFARQKRALETSFHLMLLAAMDEKGPGKYLKDLAVRHGAGDLGVGSELYDLWLSSLVETARRYDPDFTDATEEAWRDSLAAGIEYMRSHY